MLFMKISWKKLFFDFNVLSLFSSPLLPFSLPLLFLSSFSDVPLLSFHFFFPWSSFRPPSSFVASSVSFSSSFGLWVAWMGWRFGEWLLQHPCLFWLLGRERFHSKFLELPCHFSWLHRQCTVSVRHLSRSPAALTPSQMHCPYRSQMHCPFWSSSSRFSPRHLWTG